MTGGLTDDKQGGFRMGRGCIDQIFKLTHIGEKTTEKKCSVRRFHRFGEGVRVIGKLCGKNV